MFNRDNTGILIFDLDSYSLAGKLKTERHPKKTIINPVLNTVGLWSTFENINFTALVVCAARAVRKIFLSILLLQSVFSNFYQQNKSKVRASVLCIVRTIKLNY